MEAPTNWWHLYEVTFASFEGKSGMYRVVTDRGQLKAVAIAAAAHTTKEWWTIHDVAIVDRGRSDRVEPQRGDLTDRMEW